MGKMTFVAQGDHLKKLQNYLFNRFPDGNYAGASRDEWQMICPRCRDERAKAYVNIYSGAGTCFACQVWEVSNWWALIASVEELPSIRDAELWFDNQHDFTPFVYEREQHPALRVKLMDRKLPKEYQPLIYLGLTEQGSQVPYREYLKRRLPQLTKQDIEDFRIGYCTTGKYEGRLIFPVYYHGDLEFFMDRLVPGLGNDGAPKTLGIGSKTTNEKWQFSKGQVIWGLERVETDPSIIEIAEGVFSALSCSNRTVALLGKTATDYQLNRLIITGCRHFILTLDPGTEVETTQLAYRLSQWDCRVFVRKLETWTETDVNGNVTKKGDPNDYLLAGKTLPEPVEWGMKDRIEASMRGWISEKESTWR